MTKITLYEVGGSIRDTLLGKTSPDRDFVAVVEDGNWTNLLAWADAKLEKVFQIREEFFTIRGILAGQAIDIVMARKEGEYLDGRHPKDVQPGTLEEDLLRRDFTINAMAWEVDENLNRIGDLIDPRNGMLDLHNRQLVTVKSVEECLQEDMLRLLRAIRFKITRNLHISLALHNALLYDGAQWAARLQRADISVDRKRTELEKMFKHDSVHTLRLLSRIDQTLAAEILRGLWLLPTTRSK